MLPFYVREHIRLALEEDIGMGDITTEAIAVGDEHTVGFVKVKEPGVVAGLFVLEEVYRILSDKVHIDYFVKDGDEVTSGQVIAKIYGPAAVILMGERVALNYLQFLSGIATKTRRIINLVKDYPVRVVDTRKTVPGLRWLSKYAVRVGGGHNHRFNLSDGILIKDNHIKAAGGIKEAIKRARRYAPHTLRIEIEVESLEELKEAIAAGADIVMLDNMSPQRVKEARKIAGDKVLLEVSGGISEENILEYARAGIDVISLGTLTHSVKALDISLDLISLKESGL
ncbi:nicotinate-nucleotide diphosphorylase (carboxylating) [Carboxydothermus islandicus]|uniref:Probable nicotinate-nucleotide pyrophosphorylase [carboxylating] n=1 Tax=Carboxydothermus islandicus TaxID=661089 RepID=A0A1L8D4F1_9THEO|nr:carboxylating nicotinate-nucleotide diphosphorylase [Carboxydothermus islandicus]GAV26052.1 nicotinate-nucleotide diphosphorylase (carboxylating) [Carboxydothermus islandicus]